MPRSRPASPPSAPATASAACRCSATTSKARWAEFLPAQQASAVERQRARRLEPGWLERLPTFLKAWMPAIEGRRSLLHTELMREHLLVTGDGSDCG